MVTQLHPYQIQSAARPAASFLIYKNYSNLLFIVLSSKYLLAKRLETLFKNYNSRELRVTLLFNNVNNVKWRKRPGTS